jgi:putative ABC transport system substrate-binding protein
MAADHSSDNIRAFQLGLKGEGYVDGETLSIIYRWADNQVERMPELAADLVGRRVAAIVALGGGAFPAKAATTTIPVVFLTPEDPVRLGLVASIARPGGNLTGVNFVSGELVAKRLEFLRQLLPTANRVGVLLHPQGLSTDTTLRDVEAMASAMGFDIQVVNAHTSNELDAAFAAFARDRRDAVFVANNPYYTARRVQLSLLAMRYQIPTVFSGRQYVEAGGLMSYGGNLTDAFRQIGTQVGRVLKGAKPADLPVLQASKFELVINIQTARMLGLTVPSSLLSLADEVIE